jgi:hypothetical protein
LLAAALLLSVLSCSKKEDDPVAAGPTNVGSYKLDSREPNTGQVVNRQVEAKAHLVFSTDANNDEVEVRLTTTPQPAIGVETLILVFAKPKGQPDTAYRYFGVSLYDGVAPLGLWFMNDRATITPTRNGGFSGTFTASRSIMIGLANQKDYTLEGVFTDVRP